ncbi:MAG: methyltransferase [Planctomycetota bacterium]
MSQIEALLEMDLQSSGGDWTPTPHGRWLAQMLAEHDLVRDRDVLELGAGVANHTILLYRRGARSIVATEIADEFLATAKTNYERNCGTDTDVEFRVADWLDTPGRFDTVVTNPPFCQSGKQNRRYYIDSLVLDAHKRLRKGGEIVFVQSSMADVEKTKRLMDDNGFDVEEIGRTSGPFRDYYYDDPTFLEEIERVEGGYEERDGVRYETLVVLHGRLRDWSPPPTAHLPPTAAE